MKLPQAITAMACIGAYFAYAAEFASSARKFFSAMLSAQSFVSELPFSNAQLFWFTVAAGVFMIAALKFAIDYCGFFGASADVKARSLQPELRLLIIGKSGDGKSTLVNALRDPEYSIPAVAKQSADGLYMFFFFFVPDTYLHRTTST